MNISGKHKKLQLLLYEAGQLQQWMQGHVSAPLAQWEPVARQWAILMVKAYTVERTW